MRRSVQVLALLTATFLLSGCSMMHLMRTMLATNEPNEKILGQLFAVGGGGEARFGSDGVARIAVDHDAMETIFERAVITMDRPGTLELTLNNNNPQAHLIVVVQSELLWRFRGSLAAIAPHMIGAPRGDALYVFALP